MPRHARNQYRLARQEQEATWAGLVHRATSTLCGPNLDGPQPIPARRTVRGPPLHCRPVCVLLTYLHGPCNRRPFSPSRPILIPVQEETNFLVSRHGFFLPPLFPLCSRSKHLKQSFVSEATCLWVGRPAANVAISWIPWQMQRYESSPPLIFFSGTILNYIRAWKRIAKKQKLKTKRQGRMRGHFQ